MKTLFILLVFLFTATVSALEIDEKLTVRIIRASETRKTIMINRGTEDGLVEGDHAKFLVTAGIVARAVCVRVSPSRSVWSVYRLVNSDFIVNDSVMTLKISPPVKITKDESQTLVQEDVPARTSPDTTNLGIPLAEGAQDLGSDANMVNADLKALEENQGPVSIAGRNKEIFGIINISGLASSSKSATQSFTGSQSFYHIGLGGELYGQREREWYSRFSVFGSVNLMRENSVAYNGASVVNETTEFSFGTNWHPFKLPSVTNEFIPFFHLGIDFGTVKSTYNPGTEGGNLPVSRSSNGGSSGYSVGFGYKFYTNQGFGARAMLDYYTRAEKYKQDTNGDTMTKVVSGPRLMIGISYRF